jgi:hypothetical protein
MPNRFFTQLAPTPPGVQLALISSRNDGSVERNRDIM